MHSFPNLTGKEHAAILAALQLFKQGMEKASLPPDIEDIATLDGTISALCPDAIDRLCERIKTDPTTLAVPSIKLTIDAALAVLNTILDDEDVQIDKAVANLLEQFAAELDNILPPQPAKPAPPLHKADGILTLILEMGHVIRALDKKEQHITFWTQDGGYLLDNRFPETIPSSSYLERSITQCRSLQNMAKFRDAHFIRAAYLKFEKHRAIEVRTDAKIRYRTGCAQVQAWIFVDNEEADF